MRHAIVIGGSRGIGREVVNALCATGERCSVFGLHKPVESDLEKPLRHYWSLNLLDPEQRQMAIDSALDYYGNLTHIVFCQRYRGEEDAWRGEMETSLTVTKHVIEYCAPKFWTETEAGIVILSSIIAHSVANEQPVGYHVAKAALEGMARYYAVILGWRGIRVNCVAPGVTLKDENKKYYDEHSEKVDLFSRINPLRRMGTAEDVAQVVAWLCSPGASYVTGNVITVDGGVSLLNQEALARSFLKEGDK